MSTPSIAGHALGGLFIVNLRGDVLLTRAYREDIERHVVDAFRSQISIHAPRRRARARAGARGTKRTRKRRWFRHRGADA